VLVLGVAAALSLAAAPAASAIPAPPTDVVYYDPGSGCPPEGGSPCNPRPTMVKVNTLYAGELVAWAEGILP
jgi:hypothetical protein